MAAYPLTAFSYPSPSPLPIQFQQPYLTAVPMTYMPSPDIAAAQGALVSVGSSYVTYIDKKGQLLDTLPICRDFKSRRCTRPQCKYVHLAEDFVEVTNGYVCICKQAIMGNCSKKECKFIIYVLKNFNGKFFISIIIKVGVRTLPTLS
ncbi:unnamed protein product [Rotaria magnacalcarata]|nr:unnamed protein product [Rotaria magnacalcarata]CAF1374906.1 unnamed protein product [Rotaria magnacalcarata]